MISRILKLLPVYYFICTRLFVNFNIYIFRQMRGKRNFYARTEDILVRHQPLTGWSLTLVYVSVLRNTN